MTEAEWLECYDPQAMLEFLGPVATSDKFDRYKRGCLMWEFLQRGGPFAEFALAVGRFYDGRIAAEELAVEAERWKRKAGAWALGVSGEVRPTKGTSRSCCQVIREVFGNPFCGVTFDPTWRQSEILTLARLLYDTQAFDRLPELADALEGAGCDSADILEHCRRPGPHVRGCWVVDVILGQH